MKYIVLLGDGMADIPVPQLDNKTPLQYAKIPNMDWLAQRGEMGLVHTIPPGMSPASDVANLSTMGFDPEIYYTGRSPLEAVSMGIDLKDSDVALRCNLVTLTEEEDYYNKTIIDHSSDEISTEEAQELMNIIKDHLDGLSISFFAGISYRHCMVWDQGSIDLGLTPPHDILNKTIGEYLPSKESSSFLGYMMEESFDILNNHPINKIRKEQGLNPANSIWLWGEGKKPSLPSFKELYNKKGSVISAVDLIKGIGICAGLTPIEVDGATGDLNTNYRGKAQAALRELESDKDFVYIHVEAPDECGHRQEVENKVKAIEMIDKLLLGPLMDGLNQFRDYKIMVLPDHPTPLALRTHTSDPVPYIIYHKDKEKINSLKGYDELQAKNTGISIKKGHTIMSRFFDL